MSSHPQEREIAVRAYAVPNEGKKDVPGGGAPPPPSSWTLTFAVATGDAASQRLRFLVYQVRKGSDLRGEGIAYELDELNDAERSRLYAFATSHGFDVMAVTEFVDNVFFPVVYDREGCCVGADLPFALSRLAVSHGNSPAPMRGGFTFRLVHHGGRPNVQVKHLEGGAALIRFTIPPGQRTPRGMRRRRLQVRPTRGHFADVRTLGKALLGERYPLSTLAHLLGVPFTSPGGEDQSNVMGTTLGTKVEQVRATWECFAALRARYDGFGLAQTPITAIYSEASIGKAVLRQLGVRPWRQLQPSFPPELLGQILCAAHGGRADVHLRRILTRVLYCDVRAAYPAAFALLGLWPFVVAEGVASDDATDEVRHLLDSLTVAQLADAARWQDLRVLVQVSPTADLLPTRSGYGDSAALTTGLNELTIKQPLWFTLADCAVATVLNDKPLTVLQALRFRPVGSQANLHAFRFGDDVIDPTDDVPRRLVEVRRQVQAEAMAAREVGDGERADLLEARQLALKATVNALCSGIPLELNVVEYAQPQPVTVYGPDGVGREVKVSQVEEPGTWFHPLLGVLVAGAVRLLLALAQRIATDHDLDWAFCDTDSIALARPPLMNDADFMARTRSVCAWFEHLNPYADGGPLLRTEPANFRLADGRPTDDLEPLWCLAVSPKRYALFNRDANNQPILRKASAHGLGHLLPPYGDADAPADIPPPAVPLADLGVERWQHDLWIGIVEAVLEGHPERPWLHDLPGYNQPAVSRYAATSPRLLAWFDAYNRDRPDREQVRPFGELYAFQSKALPHRWPSDDGLRVGDERRRRPSPDTPRAVAPYHSDLAVAVQLSFDRTTGLPVPPQELKTYRQALAQYHLHPDPKAANAGHLDAGPTGRRRVAAERIRLVGKEANRWEEQLHLGSDPEAQVDYGLASDGIALQLEQLRVECRQYSVRTVAQATGLSVGEVVRIRTGQGVPTEITVARLQEGLVRLRQEDAQRADEVREELEDVRNFVVTQGVRGAARVLGVSPSVLSRVLSGTRRVNPSLVARLSEVCAAPPVESCTSP